MSSPRPSWVVGIDPDSDDLVVHHMFSPGQTQCNSHTSIARDCGIDEDTVLRVEIEAEDLRNGKHPGIWSIDRLPFGKRSIEEVDQRILDMQEEVILAFMTLENASAYICFNPDAEYFAGAILTNGALQRWQQAWHEYRGQNHQLSQVHNALLYLSYYAIAPSMDPRTNADHSSFFHRKNMPTECYFTITDDMLRNPNIWPHLYKEETNG